MGFEVDGRWECSREGCGASWCSCGRPSHWPAPCAALQQWENRGGYVHYSNQQDSDSLRLVSLITKPCPNCFYRLERFGGCAHMTCKQCKCEFNWNCLCKHNSCTCGKTDAQEEKFAVAHRFDVLNARSSRHALSHDIALALAKNCKKHLGGEDGQLLAAWMDAALLTARAHKVILSAACLEFQSHNPTLQAAVSRLEGSVDKLQMLIEQLALEAVKVVRSVESSLVSLGQSGQDTERPPVADLSQIALHQHLPRPLPPLDTQLVQLVRTMVADFAQFLEPFAISNA